MRQLETLWTHSRPKPRLWDGRVLAKGTRAERKWNGLRTTFFKQPDGAMKVFGREDIPSLELSNLLYSYDFYQFWMDRLPPHSSVDGELITPNEISSDVKHAMIMGDCVLFKPFYTPFWKGVDLRRREWTDSSPTDVRPQQLNIHPSSFSIKHLVDECARRGWEGVVLKENPYDSWWKVKVVQTIDAICTGLVPGKGKYKDLVGALKLSLYRRDGSLVEIGRCSGFTDNARARINKGSIGRVVEVEFNDITTHQRLQHARFLHWREDKRAEDCCMSQLPNNE